MFGMDAPSLFPMAHLLLGLGIRLTFGVVPYHILQSFDNQRRCLQGIFFGFTYKRLIGSNDVKLAD